ncbi:MAG: NAD(P)H-binding protein [Cyanobacteria bacterium SZAS-4]|nr:NAD(P)H-binding protein [Cyanobacteria bacterium SZAS-4]
MKIVVIGGFGLIGALMVERLRKAGHDAVPASPRVGVNTVTGEGLAQALKGARVVVDVTNPPSFEEKLLMDLFDTGTRNLLAAAITAGVKHYVVLSVVGTDRMQDSPYFRAKLVQERHTAGAKVPYTIVRATQFFEFLGGIADFSTKENKACLTPIHMQPMAAADVATEMCDIALESPANGIIEIGGPERISLSEIVGKYLKATHDKREVVTDENASYFGMRLDDQSLVPAADARLSKTTFDQWMSQAAVSK